MSWTVNSRISPLIRETNQFWLCKESYANEVAKSLLPMNPMGSFFFAYSIQSLARLHQLRRQKNSKAKLSQLRIVMTKYCVEKIDKYLFWDIKIKCGQICKEDDRLFLIVDRGETQRKSKAKKKWSNFRRFFVLVAFFVGVNWWKSRKLKFKIIFDHLAFCCLLFIPGLTLKAIKNICTRWSNFLQFHDLTGSRCHFSGICWAPFNLHSTCWAFLPICNFLYFLVLSRCIRSVLHFLVRLLWSASRAQQSLVVSHKTCNYELNLKMNAISQRWIK